MRDDNEGAGRNAARARHPGPVAITYKIGNFVSPAEKIMSSFWARLAFSFTLLGISESAMASMNCGAEGISRDEDYLMNLRSVIESDCLQDFAENDKVLREVFATNDVRVTYLGRGKINYAINVGQDNVRSKVKPLIKIALRTDAAGGKKMSIDAYFPEGVAITHEAFLDKWTVTRQPSLRSPHLPANLHSYRYTLSGRHPGAVAITTNGNSLLTYLGFEER